MWGHVTEEEEDGRLRRAHHVLGGRHELDGAQRELGPFEAVAAQPGVGFFQIDCLGYGPWLDARTVQYLASATGGEALMVEELALPRIR